MNRTKMLAVTTGAIAAVAMATVPALAVDDTTGAVAAEITVNSTGALQINGPTGTVNLGSAGYDVADPASVTSWATDALDVVALQTSLAGQADIVGTFADGGGQGVTVVDGRLGIVASWTSTVEWTDFKLGGTGSTVETIIAQDQLRYSSGAATLDGGLGTFTPQLSAVQNGGIAATYVGALQVSGSNSVSWTPKIYVDLQGEQAGTYTGTITHSVTGT